MGIITTLLSLSRIRCPSFTVDTTGVSYVQLVSNTGGVPRDLYPYYDPGSKIVFQRGDNIRIESIGYFIPERFVLSEYDYNPALSSESTVMIGQFKIVSSATGLGPALSAFGSDGLIKYPLPNIEIPIGTFIEVEDLVSDKFLLQLDFPVSNNNQKWFISMHDVPPEMNGTVVRVTPFVKVSHNLVLTT